jgi:hypothetical protein
LSLWTKLGISKGENQNGHTFLAWTPVSVLPAPMILISELSKVEIALFIVSWIDEAFGWYCQPWYSDPLYANFIKYLIWTFGSFVLQNLAGWRKSRLYI